jgi:hypothetical protein
MAEVGSELNNDGLMAVVGVFMDVKKEDILLGGSSSWSPRQTNRSSGC